MAKHVPISSPLAPPAIGPYSPGVRVENLIFISGQLPIDMSTKKLAGADIASQTHQAIKNVQCLVEATGASLGNIVKVTVYLKDLGDFKAMNEVYAEYFVHNPPARACVEVARLPYNSLIEIEAIAHHQRPVSGLDAQGL
jgi:2-iminobutanoate/2-iminopropanoate deaminase